MQKEQWLTWSESDLRKMTTDFFARIAEKRCILWAIPRGITVPFACGRFTWTSIRVTVPMIAADRWSRFVLSQTRERDT